MHLGEHQSLGLLYFAGTNFLRLGQMSFSYWELIFAIFRKCPVPSIDDICVFIENAQKKYIFSNNTTVCVSISLYTALFLNERDKL